MPNFKKKYTDKDKYSVIYLFFTRKDIRASVIAKELGTSDYYAHSVLNGITGKHIEFSQLSRDAKSMDKFIEININFNKIK